MSAGSTNPEVIAAAAKARRDTTTDPGAPPRVVNMQSDPTDAPQAQSSYLGKAIQSVMEALGPPSEHKGATQEVHLLEAAVEQARDAIVICAAPTQARVPAVQYTNQAFSTMTGLPRSEMQGKPLFDLPGWGLVEGGRRRILKTMRAGITYEGELCGTRLHGAEYIVEVRFNPIIKDGDCTHFIGIIRDITEKKRIERELVHNAHHDHLTGLPNRKLFRDRLDQAVRRSDRYKDGVSLLYIDLDGFKPINDSLGHQMGDEVLQVVSKRLLTTVRASDTVARLGGDEFAILLPGVDRPEDANRVAAKVVNVVSEVIVGQGKEIFITPSIGISHFNHLAKTGEELIRQADQAMYQAKMRGKGQYCVFTEELKERHLSRDVMADELSSALSLNEFGLHYRLIQAMASEETCGIEPLLRWNHPQQGMVSPARFLPLLAQLPCEREVGLWFLRAGCAKVLQCPPHIQLYHSLFKNMLNDSHLSEDISSILSETGLEPKRLVLQIPESALSAVHETTIHQLNTLKDLGVSVMITHYGTSNLSLPQLRSLPIDGLKIDASLVERLETDTALIGGIIALSHSLGLSVSADGLESSRQARVLKQLGCHRCQGPYIGRPSPKLIL